MLSQVGRHSCSGFLRRGRKRPQVVHINRRNIQKPTWNDFRYSRTPYDDDDDGSLDVVTSALDEAPEDEKALDWEMKRGGDEEEGGGMDQFWDKAEKKLDKDFFENTFDMDDMLSSQGIELHEKADAKWSGKFVDSKGPADITIEQTRELLWMKVRGFKVSSHDFVSWRPPGAYLLLARPRFTMREVTGVDVLKFQTTSVRDPEYVCEELDRYIIEVDIPIKLGRLDDEGREKVEMATVTTKVIQDTTKVSKPIFRLTLKFRENHTIESTSASNFDDALMSIQMKLPDKLYFKNCWGCAFAEYSPMGQRKTGSLACFRDFPEVKQIRSTLELLRAWPRLTEKVQEVHSCDMFSRRSKPRPKPFEGTVKV